MRVIRGLLWGAGAIALIAAAVAITKHGEIADRLTSLFLSVQLSLPQTLTLEQFLAVLTVASALAALLILIGSAAIIARISVNRRISDQQQLTQTGVAKREMDHVKEQYRSQYGELLSIAQALSKRLDKRVLVQTIIEAASQLTSVPDTNSVVSLWLLNLESDTIRFERGHYCDESLFTRTEFQLTEPPFARVLTMEQPLLVPAWDDGLTLIKREKASQLGSATAVMVVPLMIESSVLGILVVSCHPDILKSYEEQRPFYDTAWGELALGLAIAIQGEVAILDRLTGVHNREYFMKRLLQEIERANRYQLPLSLLMIDIDNFKLVNDMLGHPQGDAVLKIIAKLLKKSVRAIDLIGRYGGEEFIVMLPETGYSDDPTNVGGAAVVAERIRKAVDDEFRGLQKPLNLTVSVGVACRRFPEDRASDYRDLIRLTDEQLYRAKTTGKNKVCLLVHEKPHAVP